MNEFALIDAYFKRLSDRAGALLSSDLHPDMAIGDDCALVQVPQGQRLAISADTLVNGVHFPVSTQPYDVGYKSLAVNLSDLASMGATPAWFTLCITMNDKSAAWVESFCDGMAAVMQAHPIMLIGGDTTQGPLCISAQVMGLVPQAQALTRCGAQVGDDVYVSGRIGEAALGLALIQQRLSHHAVVEPEYLLGRLNRPTPRVSLGKALLGVATACIDVSDGLLADLYHILVRSGVGAELQVDAVPVAAGMDPMAAMSAGDDYELCFTAPVAQRETIDALADTLNLPLTRVGTITEQPGLVDQNGEALQPAGYTHF